MDGKIRHRPTTFMGVQDLTRPFSSPNCSNTEEVRICPTAQTLFSVQPKCRVLEVQMILIFYPGKLRQFLRTFMFKFVHIMTLLTNKKIRIVTKSRCGHLFIN
jgi:hypothetical protein